MENESIKCNSCGTELTEADNFCPNCGARRQNEPTRCKFCGTELEETDKFCPNCGKRRNAKSKKPLFRKWWFWLVGLVVIGILAGGGKDVVSGSDPTTPPAIEAPLAEKADEPAALELLQSLVESTIGSYYDYYEVYVNADETTIAIQLANNGLGEAVFAAKDAGFDESFEAWAELRNSHLELYDSIREMALTLGLDDVVINIFIKDDQNHDRVFLVISDGAVLYDYMAS